MFHQKCMILALYTNKQVLPCTAGGTVSLPNIQGAYHWQGRSYSKYHAELLALVGEVLVLVLGIFTACQNRMTGSIFFCKIIPASYNLASFLHSVFMKSLSFDPEYRKLFQDLHCQAGSLYVYDFYHIIFLLNSVLTQRQAGKLSDSRWLSDNQGKVIFSSKNIRPMSCVI